MRITRFDDFEKGGPLDEAAKMPGAFPNLVRQAKKSNDELQALLEQVREKTRETEALDSAVESKMREMEQTTARVGKIIVSLVEKPGRASYSYTEAQSIYYQALMKVDKAAAAATAKLVEGLKKINPGKTEVKFAVSESVLAWAKEWLSRVWSGIVSAFRGYESAADELERVVTANESVGWLRSTAWGANLGFPHDVHGGYDRAGADEAQAQRLRKRREAEDRAERLGLKPGMPVRIEVPGEATEDPAYIRRLRDVLRRNGNKPGNVGSIDQGAGEALVHFPAGQTVRVQLADLRVVEGFVDEGAADGKGPTLPSRQDPGSWGFFGTLSRGDRRGAEAAWDRMFKFVRYGKGFDPSVVRDFLDSVDGRHLADAWASASQGGGDPHKTWAWAGGDKRIKSFMRGYDPEMFESSAFKLDWKKEGKEYSVEVSDSRFDWDSSTHTLTMTDVSDGTSLTWRGKVKSLEAASSVVGNTLDGGDDKEDWGLHESLGRKFRMFETATFKFEAGKHSYDKATRTFTVSERDVPFDTTYVILNPASGGSKEFSFVRSTGPEHAASTRWIYKSADGFTLEVCNDAEMVKKASADYLRAKMRGVPKLYESVLNESVNTGAAPTGLFFVDGDFDIEGLVWTASGWQSYYESGRAPLLLYSSKPDAQKAARGAAKVPIPKATWDKVTGKFDDTKQKAHYPLGVEVIEVGGKAFGDKEANVGPWIEVGSPSGTAKRAPGKSKSDSVTPAQFRAAVLRYFGRSESEVVPAGRHWHSYGYAPKFELSPEKLYAVFDTGKTVRADGPGTYSHHMISVMGDRGKWSAVVRKSVNRNEHENGDVSDRCYVDYEKFDSFEKARDRVFKELGLI